MPLNMNYDPLGEEFDWMIIHAAISQGLSKEAFVREASLAVAENVLRRYLFEELCTGYNLFLARFIGPAPAQGEEKGTGRDTDEDDDEGEDPPCPLGYLDTAMEIIDDLMKYYRRRPPFDPSGDQPITLPFKR